MDAAPRKQNKALLLLLFLLLLIFIIRGLFLYVRLQNAHSFLVFQNAEIIPYHMFFALLGIVSVVLALLRKRLGAYGLAAAWLGTSALNLLFDRPVPVSLLVVSALLAAAFVWLVRPVWDRMQ